MSQAFGMLLAKLFSRLLLIGAGVGAGSCNRSCAVHAHAYRSRSRAIGQTATGLGFSLCRGLCWSCLALGHAPKHANEHALGQAMKTHGHRFCWLGQCSATSPSHCALLQTCPQCLRRFGFWIVGPRPDLIWVRTWVHVPLSYIIVDLITPINFGMKGASISSEILVSQWRTN